MPAGGMPEGAMLDACSPMGCILVGGIACAIPEAIPDPSGASSGGGMPCGMPIGGCCIISGAAVATRGIETCQCAEKGCEGRGVHARDDKERAASVP